MLQIVQVTDAVGLAHCHTIRRIVFVEEQQVSPEEEWDDLDASATHYLLYREGAPVGTVRLRILDDTAKIERVAMLAACRGSGLGAQLMQHVMAQARLYPSVRRMRLGAQVQAIPFYEKCGFTVCSELYLDAGIPHRWMECAA